MSDSPPSIFDSPHRAEEIRKAQADWDELMRSDARIYREMKQRRKSPGPKPRGSL